MRDIEVSEAIDDGPFGRFQWMVVALCGALLIVDGYDVFVAGTVLPTLIAEWGLTKPQAGALQAWALFGMMFGALILGPLADRIGRKKGVAISFALFTSATVMTGFASTPEQFKVFRFIAGLGCGGLMPNAVALMNEYAPKRLRGTMVALMFSGYSVGGMVAAGLGIGLIPAFGWQPMFFIAALPLALLPLILWRLPESLGFLIRQGRQDEARRIFARIAPAVALSADDRLVFGGRGAPYHFGSAVRPGFDREEKVFEALRTTLRTMFPVLEPTTFTHAWGGALGIPRDWIASVGLDRGTGIGGFWATQILPFADAPSVGGYLEFETAVYAAR